MDSTVLTALRNDDLKTLQQVYTPALLAKQVPHELNVLDEACFQGSLNCALWLIEEVGAIVDEYTLFWSIASQDSNIVKHILGYCTHDVINTKDYYCKKTALENAMKILDYPNLKEDEKLEVVKIIDLLKVDANK